MRKVMFSMNISIDGCYEHTLFAPGEELAADLIDELYLIIHPILSGEHKRLFDEFLTPEKHNFQLAYTQPFPSGAIALHYQKRNTKDF
jgi:hypothetical protein